MVSSADSLPLLRWMGDMYMPLEEADPRLAPKINGKSTKYIIVGTSHEAFCAHLKAIAMLRMMESTNSVPMYAANSRLMTETFVFPNEEGQHARTLSDMDRYDIVAIEFTGRQKNEGVRQAMSEAVSLRIANHKAIWLWLPPPVTSVSSCKEDSPELSDMTADFARINLRLTGPTANLLGSSLLKTDMPSGRINATASSFNPRGT
jgi:hypothetical protein